MSEWMPGAIRHDGPSTKVGYSTGQVGPKRGEVKHSAVGSVAGALSVLNNLDVRSSWHFTIAKDGKILQHYPVSTHCWHGNDTDPDDAVAANIDLIGIEHEGGPPNNVSEPLTIEQIASTIEVSRWAAAQYGFTSFTRFPDQSGWTLAEHKEVGNTATACPSNRIPWEVILASLNPAAPVPPPIDPDQIALAILRANNEVILSLAIGNNHCIQQGDGRIEWKYTDENGAGHSFDPPIFLPLGGIK